MAAISLWKTIKKNFLFSLSYEVATCTKVRLAGFQTTIHKKHKDNPDMPVFTMPLF